MNYFRIKKHMLFPIGYIICFFCVLIIALKYQLVEKETGSPKQNNCLEEVSKYTVRGNSMSPLIEDGSTVEGIDGYYACTSTLPEHGDIVILEDSAMSGPNIKTIGALPGDRLILTESGTLLVNDMELRNKNGDPYRFQEKEKNFLNLYILDGKLQNGAYFIFGENTINSRDSRKIGAVSLGAFLVKITKINGVPIREN